MFPLFYNNAVQPTLRTGVQFAALNRKKLELAKRSDESGGREIARRCLAPRLLDFELSKLRQRILTPAVMEPPSERLEQAFDYLIDFHKSAGELDLSDLLELHTILEPAGRAGLRRDPAEPLTPLHQPLDAATVSGALTRFLEWVQSQAFSEMHPVEQVTLAQIRLYEIYPFEVFCELTVSLFSYTFLVAAGFLPPLYEAAELPDFYLALDAAFAFSTQGLVNLNAKACERAYDCALRNI